MNKLAKIQMWLHAVSGIAMAVFVYLFVSHNSGGLTSLPVIALLGGSYVAIFLLANPGLLGGRNHLLPAGLSRTLYAATAVALPLLFLNATVWDYYQPISLFEDATIALALSWLLMVIASILALIQGQKQFALAAGVALLGTVFVMLVHLATNPQPISGLSRHTDLYDGRVDGYDVYRIPALFVIPAGSTLANGTVLESDRVIAMAEARRDGALDTGVIDLVQKISDDGGDNWSSQQVICTHKQGRQRGKCGNATPVFDHETGTAWLAYNLSGIPKNLPEGPRPHTAHMMRSDDGGLTWLGAAQLPFDNAIFGPGHGVQKRQAPATGRLIIPANQAGSHSFAIYSDDHGASWQRGAMMSTGNENEIAELSDGKLYMASRHVAPVGDPPRPNGRMYAISADGGESWGEPRRDTSLPTPICQASVLRYDDNGVLLFSNPSHSRARVQMTVRASSDDGQTWDNLLLVYPGPAGYSQLARLSNGEVALLYERGDMEYSEMISFARIPSSALFLEP